MAPKKRKSTKEKENVEATSEDEFYYQTFRIVYSDPYATESSSDEQVQKTNPSKPLPPKRILCEFVQPNPEIVKKLPQKQGLWRRFSTSIYKGVRRLRGKKERYAAQIRNPFEKTTEYLGTHDTEYEAALAYRRKTKEFHRRKLADSNKDKQEEAVAPPSSDFVLDQPCNEQGKGYDPSDDDDDDNNGGGSSHQNIIDVAV